MRTLPLGKTGLSVSHLGFGCSHLTSARSPSEAVRILEQAFSQGITHFDVARIYGQGRSEGILGEFLKGKRNQVTVATKFGIQPPAGLAGNRWMVDLAKKILSPFPSLLGRLKKKGGEMVQAGVFTPEAAVQSLEISLRELGTDFVDVFFLHEATLQDASNDPLIEALQAQVSLGKIRSFGIASRFEYLRGDASVISPAYQILQFDDNLLARNLQKLAHREGFALATHTIFQPATLLREAIASQPVLAEQCKKELNLDVTDPNVVGALLLQYALHSNSEGVVLFSSLNAARIAANVREARNPSCTGEQVAGFLKFAAELTQAVSPK